MTLDLWALAILLAKFAAYVSFVSLIGGFFVVGLVGAQQARGANGTAPSFISYAFAQRLAPFLLLNSVLGLFSVALFFLLQVGSINQNGFVGMFDWLMSTIVMQTAIGDGVVWKAAGFLAFGIAALLLRYADNQRQNRPARLMMLLILAFGFAATCTGFAKMGHVVSLGVLEQLLLALHVLAVAMWVGAFYPLLLLCKSEPGTVIYPLMKRFGDWGWGIIASLSVAAVYLLTQLLSSPIELISTAYGGILLLKILLVLCLLGLAALNKFRLVPALQVAGVAPLTRSIKGEMSLGFVILIITAILSTVTGPAHLM